MQPDLLVPLSIFIAFIIFRAYKNWQYKKGAYYQITKNPYSSVRRDRGKHGEYLTYQSLRQFEDDGGRFLFNLLIPKSLNETTEIDVVLICSKGLFVFECKNYSGWIFGDEAQKNWTQTLPMGPGQSRKERFYNPIMQNAAHIKHLKNIVGSNAPIRSIIVFSDRCTLKNVTVRSQDTTVLKHHRVSSAVKQICDQMQASVFTEAEIDDIYSRLFPYTQSDHETKIRHVENIGKDFDA